MKRFRKDSNAIKRLQLLQNAMQQFKSIASRIVGHMCSVFATDNFKAVLHLFVRFKLYEYESF